MHRQSIFYLDTSALNYLADNFHDFDCVAAMKKHLGFDLYLSLIGLWEILLNSDEKRRDHLIYWAQFNCSKDLLKSPSEIIIDYIQQGCPLKDRESFIKHSFTHTTIGSTWKNLHKKADQTLVFDFEALKARSHIIQDFSKTLKKIIEDMCGISNKNYNPLEDTFNATLEKILKNLKCPSLIENHERPLKISVILTFFILCIGIELENNTIHSYWNNLRIEDPFHRLDYLAEKYPNLIIRGPIVEMAKMIELQLYGNKSRGLFYDGLHCVYCYYADNFITGDSHFKNLREAKISPVYDRIIMISQINDIWNNAKIILNNTNES